MNAATSPIPALGRILLALIFVLSGIRQLGAVAATAATMTRHGIPAANLLVWGTVLVDLGGGLMLMTGLFARTVAFVLFLYLIVLAVVFHAYWQATGDAMRTERSTFFEHVSMMGGMLYVVAFGAGAYSLDALRDRAKAAAS
jgi:putative oxidoreductase